MSDHADNENGAPSVEAPALPPAPPREFNGRKIPPKAIGYRLTKANGEVCTFGVKDSLLVNEWPLSELDANVIADRFGPGEYWIRWVTRADDGEVTLTPPMSARKFIVAPPAAIAAAATSAPRAAPGFACCGREWPRFCGECGKSAVAPAPAMAPAVAAVLPDFMQGMTFALQMHREANALARADAERLIKREEQEHDLRVRRIDHQYAQEMRAQEERYKHQATMAASPATAHAAADPRLMSVLEKISERLDDLEEDVDDNAKEVTQVKSGLDTVTAIAKEYAPHLGPVLASVAQRLVTPAAAAAVNGKA